MAARTKSPAAARAKGAQSRRAEPVPVEMPSAPEVVAISVKPTGDGGKGLFTSLRSTIKGTYAEAIEGCTAWSSTRNERGKTARLDAVRLALTGAHPAAKRGAGLLSLSSDPTRLLARLDGPAGSASYEIPKGRVLGDHALVLHGNPAQAVLPDMQVPVMTDAALRTHLLSLFGGDVRITPPLGATEPQAESWNEAVTKVADELQFDPAKLGTDPIGRALVLAALPSTLTGMKRRTKQEADRLETHAQQVRASVSGQSEPTSDEVAAAQTATIAANRSHEIVQAYEGYLKAVAAVEDAQKTLAQLGEPRKADFSEVDKQVDVTTLAAQQAESALQVARQNTTLFAQIANLRKLHVEIAERQNGQAKCLVCESPAHVEALRIGLHQVQQVMAPQEARLQQLADEADAAGAAARKAQRAAVQARDAQAAVERQHEAAKAQMHLQAKKGHEDAMTHYVALQRIAAQAQVDVTDGARLQQFLEAARAAQPPEQAQRQYDELRARQATFLQLQKDEDKVRTLRASLTMLDNLVMAAKSQLTEELQKFAKPIEEAVQRFLPADITVRLRLVEDDGSSCCRFEVKGHDGLWRAYGAAPGRSWAALTIAVALASLVQADENAPHVVLLDDADLAPFAPAARTELLTALADCQRKGLLDHVFVACTQPDTVPDTYLHYRLD